MLSEIVGLLKSETSISHIGEILKSIEHLLVLCSEQYLKDGNAKNAMVDSIIQILQQQKSKV